MTKCTVPFCSEVHRTRVGDWLCSDHMRAAPGDLRRLYKRAARRVDDAVSRSEPRTPRANEIGFRVNGTWRVFDASAAQAYTSATALRARLWARLRAKVIETAAGIA